MRKVNYLGGKSVRDADPAFGYNPYADFPFADARVRRVGALGVAAGVAALLALAALWGLFAGLCGATGVGV